MYIYSTKQIIYKTMQNVSNTTNTGSNVAAVLLFQLPTQAIKVKPVPAVYYVESADIEGNDINVSYTLNDAWADAVISLADLKSFAVNVGLNDYCFDYSVNGNHVQDAGSLDMDTFLSENLNEAVEAYLKAKRIGQNVN